MMAPRSTRGTETKPQTKNSTKIVEKGRALEEDCDHRVRLVKKRMDKKNDGKRIAVKMAFWSQDEEELSDLFGEFCSRERWRRLE